MVNLSGQTLLNRYFLRELAGSGGMADVYQAWDKIRSTRLAIKILRRDLAVSPHFFKMFANEAEILRRLEHPNIVRLYEFERQRDLVFIIMDWVEGVSLKVAIKDQKKSFTIEDISSILQPVCSALYYAHQNRVFHCDVKPSNILLHQDGRIMLSDFGVAHLAAESTGGGTAPYMAPEQFSGGRVDGRTDIYALGVTLYEILSGGYLPFRGESTDSRGSTVRERIAWEHLHLPLPPLAYFNKNLAPAIQNVVATALQKDPNQRYATTMDMREAFEHARMQSGRGGTSSAMLQSGVTAPDTDTTRKLPAIKIPPTPQPKSPAPHLFCRSGERTGQTFPLTTQGLTIGRSSKNALQIRERSVSRAHALIWSTSQGVYIRDENSSLGTYVNGRRINQSIRLQDGDVIQIGYYQVFEFREQ